MAKKPKSKILNLPAQACLKSVIRKIRLRTWIAIGIIVVLGPLTLAAVYGVFGALGGSSATPVAVWHFDEGVDNSCANGTDDICDDSGNGNDGAFSATAPTWQTEDKCVSGKCIAFSASTSDNDHVVITNFLNPGTSDFTWTGWVNTFSINDETIFQQQDSGGTGRTWLSPASGGNWGNFLGGSARDSGIAANASEWTHIAIVHDDSANTVQWYVNGVAGNLNTSVGTETTTGDFLIGIGKDQTTEDFNGMLDEVKMFSTTLTAAQIKAEYAGGAAILGAQDTDFLNKDLVGYWPMDDNDIDSHTCSPDGGSGDACDTSGNANHGTDAGTMTDADYVGGKFGSALDFDGGDDGINLDTFGGFSDLTGSQGTVSMWVNRDFADATANNHRLVALYLSGSSRIDITYSESADTWNADYEESDVDTTSSAAASAIPQSTWSLLTYTWGDSTGILYVNGVEQDRDTITTFSGDFDDAALGADINAGSLWYDGKLDDVRMYSRALSPAEVQALYNWAPGPTGYYNFDEPSWTVDCSTTTVIDRSSNGFSGIACNGVSVGHPGKFGGASYYNGTGDDDEVRVTKSGAIDFAKASDSYTLMAWVKPEDGGMIFSDRTGGNDRAMVLYIDPQDEVLFEINDGSGNVGVGGSSAYELTLNQWTHVAAVRNVAQDRLEIYFNGVLIGTAEDTTTGDLDGGSSYVAFGNGGAATNEAFRYNGYIDEAKFYNYARTQQQIVEDMNAGHPTGGSPVGSKLLHWKFDEMYDTTAQDSGPNNYDGTFGGATNPAWTSSGKFNSALEFTATTGTDGSRVTYTTGSNLDVGTTTGDELTLSLWIKPDATQTNSSSVFIRNGTNTDENYSFYLNGKSGSNYRLSKQYHDGTAFRTLTTSTYFIPENTWSHLVLVITQGTDLKVYLNGDLIETLAWTNGNSVASTSSFNIGSHTGASAQSFDGFIDDVQVYSSALTKEQIAIVMNGNVTNNFGGGVDEKSTAAGGPGGNDPIGWWTLDEKTGTTANDKSTSANNGTLTNGPTWTGACKIGACLTFDDANEEYVTLGDQSEYDFGASADFSLSGWFKTTDATMNAIIGKGYGDNGDYSMYIHSSNQKIYHHLKDDSGNVVDTTANGPAVNDGQWHHAALVIDRAGDEATTYLDGAVYGTPVDISSLTGTFSNSNWINIGALTTDGATIEHEFEGQLDDLKIFDYALTQAQVAYEYNRGGPLAWWRLDENNASGDGITIYDASGNAFNGTADDGANDTGMDCSATGKFNTACDFDGTDDFVNIYSSGLASAFNEDEGSVSVWLKVSGSGVYTDGNIRRAIYLAADDNNRVVIQKPSSSNQIRLSYIAGATNKTIAKTTTDTEWMHWVITWSASDDEVRVYYNGDQEGTTLSSLGTWSGSIGSTTTNIGRENAASGRYWSGQIDDTRIYNYALSADQVKKLFNGGGTVRFSGGN